MAAHSTQSDAARAASDYFNDLPYEARAKLAPLLEEYRRMGIEEAVRAFKSTTVGLEDRVRKIRQRQDESIVRDTDRLVT